MFLGAHEAIAQTTTAPTPLSNGATLNNLSGSTSTNALYQITVPAGATNLRFITSGGSGGDLDIFAKFNAVPTRTFYDAKSDGPTRDERISFATPQAGTYNLLLNSYSGTYTGVSLAVAYDVPASAPPAVTLSNGVPVTNLSGGTTTNARYQITIPAGASNLRFITSGGSGGDLDIFAKFNALPTRTFYDAKSDGPTRDERITFATPQTGTYNLLLNSFSGTYTGVSLVAAYDVAATAPPAVTLSNGVPLTNLSGAQGSMATYKITVPSGATNLRFITSGGSGGDLNLYSKFSMPVTLTSYDSKSTGPAREEKITVQAPQAGTYNLLAHGASGQYSGVSLVAAYDKVTDSPTPPPPQACALSSSPVTPAIATQAAWDAKFHAQYGSSLPSLSGDVGSLAWHGHYWLRAYVSMAKTYGDTKYLDYAVRTIDYWFSRSDTSQGWGGSMDPANRMLVTGVIGQAISIFAYAVWNDPRFVAYRPKADSFIARLEPFLHTYDAQWVENAPFPGSPSFYRYATCGGLCGAGSLIMYNQGAVMAKALLMIDRTKRLKGETPDPAYLHKANEAAAYFKTFATISGTAYQWHYGGARTNTPIEDTNHAHLDLSLLVWAKNFGIGGLTDIDMQRLAATMQKILSGAAGPNDVSWSINGSGLPTSNWDRASVGYDWIELADYDPTLFDKTVKVFNTHMANPNGSRFYLGWAEILRKRKCIGL